MTTPTPEEAREALDKLVVYANNGWGSACPGEVDTLRRFIDAHSAPVQPEPVANDVLRPALRQAILALEELDGPGYLIGGVMHYRIGLLLPKLNETLASLASHPPAQPAQSLLRKPVSSIMEISATIPGGCYCPPDRCGAPVIMGRQTPCLRRDDTAAQPAQTFEQAWAEKEADGYRYGKEPLANVRLGWDMACKAGASPQPCACNASLRAAQPKREPQPMLTDAQIDAAWSALGSFTERRADNRLFARAIERLITERAGRGT